jgi:hypothetical protein
MRGALLVADQDVFDLRVEQSVVRRQNRAARITENYVDAFGDQALDDDLPSSETGEQSYTKRRERLNAARPIGSHRKHERWVRSASL